MTTILQAIILGIIQGITEWLPVSSSGHLVILQHFFRLKDQIAMNLALHIGTLFVVLFIFRNDILNILKSLIISIPKGEIMKNDGSRLAVLIIIGTIPTALIGLLLKDVIEKAFDSLLAVGIALLFTGLLLWFSRYHKEKKSFTWKDATIIGLMQGIAIFPGISRSGSTIATGLIRGINKELAARYSFLLFIPAIFGATILEFEKLTISQSDLFPIIIGTITAMIISYIFIKLLLSIVKKGKLYWFSWYCWALGTVVIVVNFV